MSTGTPYLKRNPVSLLLGIYVLALALSLAGLYMIFDSVFVVAVSGSLSLFLIYSATQLRQNIRKRQEELSLSKIQSYQESITRSQFYKHLFEVEEQLKAVELKQEGKLALDDKDISFAIEEPHPNLSRMFGMLPFGDRAKQEEHKKVAFEVREQMPQIIKSLKKTEITTTTAIEEPERGILAVRDRRYIDFTKPTIVPKSEPVKKAEKPVIEPLKAPGQIATKPEVMQPKPIAQPIGDKGLFDNKPNLGPVQPAKTDIQCLFGSSKPSLFSNVPGLTKEPLAPIPEKKTEPSGLASSDLFKTSQLDHFTSIQPTALLSNKSDFKAMNVIKEEEDSSQNLMKEEDADDEREVPEVGAAKETTDAKPAQEDEDTIKSFVMQDLDFAKLSENKGLYDQLRQLKLANPSTRADEISQSIGEFFGKVCCNVDDHFVQQCLKLASEFSYSKKSDADYYHLAYELVLKLFTECRSRYGSSKINIVS